MAGPFKAGPIDAVVGLYGYCGLRRAHRDAFVNTPYLMIAGAEDDETPPEFCERYVKWMNERGEEGNARIIVIPGEGHSFDAPYKRQLNMFNPGSRRCDLMVDEKGVTNLATGENVPGRQRQRPARQVPVRQQGFPFGLLEGPLHRRPVLDRLLQAEPLTPPESRNGGSAPGSVNAARQPSPRAVLCWPADSRHLHVCGLPVS